MQHEKNIFRIKKKRNAHTWTQRQPLWFNKIKKTYLICAFFHPVDNREHLFCTMSAAFPWPHFVCKFIWQGTEWPSLQSGPTESPWARPSVQGPEGPTPPCGAYLPHFDWAAKAAICEAVGKQMLFSHLWNPVSGEISAFWWPELSHRVQEGEGGIERDAQPLNANPPSSPHRCKDLVLIHQSDDTALSNAVTNA